jgi:hypothetical protein
MKTGTTTHYSLCRFRNAPDAACRQRRCASCGARSAPSVHGAVTLCQRCKDAANRWRLLQAERLLDEYRRVKGGE